MRPFGVDVSLWRLLVHRRAGKRPFAAFGFGSCRFANCGADFWGCTDLQLPARKIIDERDAIPNGGVFA